MAKAIPDAVLDLIPEEIATGTRLTICSDEPANFAGIAGVALADATLTAGDGNGDFTIANGDSSGRKVTIAQQDDMNIDATGDGDHVAIDDGSVLLLVTTMPSQTLTSGGTVTSNAFDCEVGDPT